MNQLFLEAIPILQKIERAGYEAVFVGGSVRDDLLKRPIHDVDIATNAEPTIIQSLFEKTIPIGIEHGTVLVRYENKSYEITTYRVEGDYSDLRRPDNVQFVSNLYEDLARRDFTINAIAMKQTGKIIDPFNGFEDLKKKILKTVNNADERFQEDPLRILRALRFVSQLGFVLEEETEKAIWNNRHLLDRIAVERIAIEWEKLLKGDHLLNSLAIILKTNVTNHLPVFKENVELLIKGYEYINSPFTSLPESIVFFTFLNRTNSTAQWCKSWKLSNAIQNMSDKLLNAYHFYLEKSLTPECLFLLEEEFIPDFAHLVNTLNGQEILDESIVLSSYKKLPIKSRKDLNINGKDIQELFPNKKPGPWLSKLIAIIETEVLNGKLKNTKDEIKKWVDIWKQLEKS